MKKVVKTVLCFGLSLSLLASLTGCSSKSDTGSKTTSSTKTDTGSSSEEPITLKMFIRNSSKYTGLQEDPVAKYIEEKFGIKIDLTVDSSLGGTSAQTSTFNELLATKLASNDLDDIMDFGSPVGNPEIVDNLNKAAESGMIIPLDDLVVNTEHLSKDPRLTIRNEYRKKFMYKDGHFYSLGGWGGMGLDQLPGAANWVRWDLYKDLGYPDIQTDEDYLNLLKQMQDKYPKTPNGDKVYGLGGGFADPEGMGDGFVNRAYPLTKGYEDLEGNYSVFIDHANREVVAPLQDPDSFFWDGVKLYYEANQMGILDPSSMTMSNSEYSEKVNNGVYLSAISGWEVMNKETILDGVGIKDSGYMPLKPLEDVNSLPMYWESVVGSNEFVITKNCKYPEKAIQFLDWCFSDEGSRVITQGAEGLAWETKDGVPTVTDQEKQDNASGTVDMAETYGKWKYAGINAFQHIDQDSNGYYIQPEQIPDPANYSAVKKDALSFYGADSFTDYFTNYSNRAGKKIPAVIWSTYTSGIGAKPDDVKQKNSIINSYMYKAVFKMVFAKNDDEYEAIKADTIAGLEAQGYSDVVKWYTDRWSELRKDLDPLINDALVSYGVDNK